MSDCSSECSDVSHISDLDDQCKSLNFDLSNGSPIDTDNFNILHYNINSILAPGKIDQLNDYCRLINIGVKIRWNGNCYSKCPVLNPKPLDSVALDVFSSHGFLQLIDIPTRITPTCMSLIDLIYVNQLDDVMCHGTLPKIADHDGLLISFYTKNIKQKNTTKLIYDYKNADIEGLI